MESKICNKCGVEKSIDEFEYRKDRNQYRNTCKRCRNSYKNEYNKKRYKEDSKYREELLAKKRERYASDSKYKEYRLKSDENCKGKRKKAEVNDIRLKIKNQLKRALDRSFTRKELKRQRPYEELLCCNIDEAVDYLIEGYTKKYGKELTINDEVDIDHVLSLWSAYRQESIEKLCCYKNLRLLSKRDNHNRKYKITKEDSQLIEEFFVFWHKYEKEKDRKNSD